jgi:hypothetical protein
MKTVVEFPSELILTLVPQGEVKVDLDEFDANFQKNFLFTAFVGEKNLFLLKCLANLFELHTGRQKMTFSHSFNKFRKKKSGHSALTVDSDLLKAGEHSYVMRSAMLLQCQ